MFPINKLPIELLSCIFSLSTIDGDTITTQSVQFPLVLSSVNRLWRQVALGTPILWSNLCITVELVEQQRRQLNTSHITSYLALSRKYPLSILIDARDENWNFEPELISDHGVEELYTPAFNSEHMNTVLALLLPHLSRWKTLSILTDCWAPMYTALNAINPFITRFGAPLLESLSLMRCNDLISFSPQFQPQQLRDPAFLKTNDTRPDSEHHPNILPSLKYLSLQGVHVDWDTLSDSLSTSETGLTSLELAWHSNDVRPSSDQFHKLLSSNSGLRNLILSGSGPSIPEGDNTVVHHHHHHDYVPVHLPHLRNITVGYRSAVEGRMALELLDAPNAKELTLEDATYAGDPEVVDAGTLLSYIGTRQLGEAHQNHHRITAYELSEYQQSGSVVDKAPCTSCTHVKNNAAAAAESRAAFPLLENVTLRGVKSCSQPLRVFFGALPNLRHLELTRMSMQAIHVLLPSGQTTTTTNCPCPQLGSLCIRGFEQLDMQDIDFIVGGLAIQRQNKGACEIREVDIHVESSSYDDDVKMTCVVPHFGSPNMKVNIISGCSEDGGGDGDWDEDEQQGVDDDDVVVVDPFAPGGAFNDPLFDACYSSHFQMIRS
ncbi:hypothetical protein BYT27DRAFT_7190385 [Phlegmacium glaucopus]|nr:hypothetical protein BYT27DRAFT_7190385 [Phlegmacium glaucopus]